MHVGLPLNSKLAGEATVRKQSTKCLQSMMLLSQDNLEGRAIRSTPKSCLPEDLGETNIIAKTLFGDSGEWVG